MRLEADRGGDLSERRLLTIATVLGAVLYPVFAVYGALNLLDGDTATGVVLLACAVGGSVVLVGWRRKAASAR